MEKPMFRAGNDAGFTLFEIIVVLILLSIVMLLVPPMFSSGVSSAEMKSTARKIALLLRKERSAAILSRKPSAFRMNVEDKIYQSGQQSRPIQISEALAVSMTTGSTLVSDNSTGQINFYPDGSSTGGRIIIRNKDQSATIDIEWLTGKVTLNE